MHPGGLNGVESIQYLLYLGEPSLVAAVLGREKGRSRANYDFGESNL